MHSFWFPASGRRAAGIFCIGEKRPLRQCGVAREGCTAGRRWQWEWCINFKGKAGSRRARRSIDIRRRACGRGHPLAGIRLPRAIRQSFADLGNSIDIVRQRVAPVSRLLVLDLAIAAAVRAPAAVEYPVAELAERFFMRLSGL